jgi:regulatory protein
MRPLTKMAKSKSSASDPFALALRLLTRRDRSEAELRDKLQQSGFSASVVEQTIDRCREYNYLNDQRYAQERARALLRSGRGVGRKILLDLRRRGIDEETATHALDVIGGELSTDQLLLDLLGRRFPAFDYWQADDRERRRVIGFFQRRGFPLEQIFRALKGEDN